MFFHKVETLKMMSIRCIDEKQMSTGATRRKSNCMNDMNNTVVDRGGQHGACTLKSGWPWDWFVKTNRVVKKKTEQHRLDLLPPGRSDCNQKCHFTDDPDKPLTNACVCHLQRIVEQSRTPLRYHLPSVLDSRYQVLLISHKRREYTPGDIM